MGLTFSHSRSGQTPRYRGTEPVPTSHSNDSGTCTGLVAVLSAKQGHRRGSLATGVTRGLLHVFLGVAGIAWLGVLPALVFPAIVLWPDDAQ